ncbi:MAG: cyclopropane-fatty-acyl-phospholipid synthase family protein [Methylacidiphilales bacterium]|nr:cyclopropane-fatty-acyl-phospholipid synthase family protein [Candidatus Methylacidiphilales bacterium]
MILKLLQGRGRTSRSLVDGKRPQTFTGDWAIDLTIRILERITAGNRIQSLNVRLWDGAYWPDQTPRAATLVLNRPSALREMFSGGSEVAVGEAYLREAFDVEGDMVAAFELADVLAAQTGSWTRSLPIAGLLFQLPDFKEANGCEKTRAARLKGAKNSPERDRKAIRFHYDVSNQFYSLWLDPRMVYSCAYFDHPGASLEQAQLRKLDLLCRKLDLHPGERLLDIGCGWGGLLMHAATRYGVRADGITLSEKQLEWTRRLIAENRLQDRVTVRLTDYREMKREETYDKAVSVGMVEHVGRKNLGVYFEQVSGLLKRGGLFLNHGIGRGPVPWTNEGEGFIDRYVFPDTDLPPIATMLEAAAGAGLEIRDVESLREHYALTLRHWVRRLEFRHEEALREVDETAYRIWRLYMAGSAHNFDLGSISIYQTLLAKLTPEGKSQATPTREKWYRSCGRR